MFRILETKFLLIFILEDNIVASMMQNPQVLAALQVNTNNYFFWHTIDLTLYDIKCGQPDVTQSLLGLLVLLSQSNFVPYQAFCF